MKNEEFEFGSPVVFGKYGNYGEKIEQVKNNFKEHGAKFFAITLNTSRSELSCWGDKDMGILLNRIKFLCHETGEKEQDYFFMSGLLPPKRFKSGKINHHAPNSNN